ncbi:translocation/assembly module TamB domain-containing protein [Salinivibrio sp. ES.052]|uniref:autotransporter assembly complex protein TamB n=1 Tax=Salinivibrio sp. ES.052 TaxID=1882823 RepID=UPI00092BB2A5|nr:translocation/assembly module TamB domain-containing protein [Salinivibrio sp. ES.052]SIO27050.1 autotransporter secretion inner membrane protein TamB [Salinivibrio sp. ES.052]
MSRWLVRLTFIVLMLTFVLVGLVSVTLFTPMGLQVGVWGAQKALPALTLEDAEGGLLTGFELHGLRYQDAQVELQAKYLALSIDGKCLLTPEICVDKLAAEGVTLDLNIPPSGDAPPAEPSTSMIQAPLPIHVNTFALNDVAMKVAGQVIDWQQLQGGVHFEGDTLTLSPTEWQKLVVTLPSEGTEQAKTEHAVGKPDGEVSSPPFDYPGLSLPTLHVPLNIDVKQLRLRDTRIDAGTVQTFSSLVLSGGVKGSAVTIDDFSLAAPQGTVRVSGDILLKGNYPLTLQSQLTTNLAPLQGQALSLSASGSLAVLEVSAKASGPVNAQLNSEANLLAADLPFVLQLNSDQITWPLTGDEIVALHGLQFSADGDFSDYQLRLQTEVDGPEVPKTQLNLAGQGSLTALTLSQLEANTLGGKVAGRASVDWSSVPFWQAELGFANIQPQQQWPEVTGNLTGAISHRGRLTAQGGWDVSVPTLVVHGELQKLPLAVAGALNAHDRDGDGQPSVSTPGLTLSHGPNHVTAQGQVRDEWQMGLSVDIADLSQSLPMFTGVIRGDARLSGPFAQPTAKLALHAKQLRWQDVRINQLTVDGDLAVKDRLGGDLTVSVLGGRYQTARLDNLDLTVRGDEAAHQLDLRWQGAPASGALRIEGALARDTGWQGKLLDTSVNVEELGDIVQQSAASIAFSFANMQTEVGEHCWQWQATQVCLPRPARLGEQGEATVNITGFDTRQIAAFFPPDWQLDTQANAAVSAHWQPESAPTVKASIDVSEGKIQQQKETPLVLGWQHANLDARWQNNQLQGALALTLEDGGTVASAFTLTDLLTSTRTVTGDLTINAVQLAKLEPLLGNDKQADINGEVNANLRIEGPLTLPQVHGGVSVSALRVKGLSSPVDVDDGQLALTLDGQQGQINGELVTPDGTLVLKGSGQWPRVDDWQFGLNVSGDTLRVNVPPMVRLDVAPDLTVSATPNDVVIRGDIRVPWGQIEVENLPESAITVSDDTVILNQNYEPEDAEQKDAVPFNLVTDVRLVLGDEVRLAAFGLKSRLAGELNIKNNRKGALIVGNVSLLEGTYRSFGQDLIIRKGEILFNGPADQPYLQVEAIRNPARMEGDVIAGIRLSGPADDPVADIFMDPAGSQANALSYLLRGRALDAGAGDANMTSMLIGIGLAQSGKLVGEIGQAFGVDDLTVDTAGAGDEQKVEVSGYILPDLEVKYGVGIFDAIGVFTVRYRLMKDLYVEAVSGVDQAVDLLYQFEIK